MARTTSISRRMVTIKGGKPRPSMGTSMGGGATHERGETASYARPLRHKAPSRSRKWWQKPEFLFAVFTVLVVSGGLAYVALTARPNTGYPQDDYYARSGGGNGGSEGLAITSDESFLAFARSQRARGEASRISHASRAPSR